uniref:Uncharacterized protein n=1 Tax=Anopheles stephensi TaxID=30069 RepID=A0A182YHP0_ANOST
MREAFPSLPFDNITEEKLLLLLLLAARPSPTAQHEPPNDDDHDRRPDELTIIGEKIIINREGETIKQTLVDNEHDQPTLQKNAVLDTDDTAQSHAGHLPAAVLTAATATVAAAAAAAAAAATTTTATTSPSVSSTTQQQHHHHHQQQHYSVAASASATAAAATFSTTASAAAAAANSISNSSGTALAVAPVPFSGELEELQNILHFPEEVALRITDMEYQLFYQTRGTIKHRSIDYPEQHIAAELDHFLHHPDPPGSVPRSNRKAQAHHIDLGYDRYFRYAVPKATPWNGTDTHSAKAHTIRAQFSYHVRTRTQAARRTSW